MSQDGQAVIVCNFPMAGTVFDWHTHPDHQLAWAPLGVLTVNTNTASYVLPPTRALWIPAGLPHQVQSAGKATMRALYLRPELCPVTWSAPTPVAVTALLAELIGHLDGDDLEERHRARAEALLGDLLSPVPMATIALRVPDDDRAREVADALAADPADRRTLAEWGHSVGASERTLARAFVTGTGMPFGRWRALLRLRASLPELADGTAIGTVARHVGYDTPSAFVAAFRRETGLTPGSYFGR
jgi:AraC-like DNA-binding protein